MMPPTVGRRQPSRRRARGAAALVVVLMLLAVVALAAAYASRNLVFEQRTATNQVRATQAFETAEAGLDWALAMLHAGRVDTTCTPLADPDMPGDSLRQRLLAIDADTGRISARTRSDGQPRGAACVFDGARWRCSCADGDAPVSSPAAPAAPAAPPDDGPRPAFIVRMHADPAHPPGVVRIESTACTRADGTAVCAPTAAGGEAHASVSTLVALKGALASPPAAAVTVRGDLNVGSGRLRAANRDAAFGGLTLHVGGALSGTPLSLHGPAGAPAASTVAEEGGAGALARLDAERLFTAVFGMSRDTYRRQPATIVVDCATACPARSLQELARLNPGRALWIDGTLRLDADVGIGSADAPLVLVVDGNVEVTAVDARIHGLVYVTGTSWRAEGASTVRGALVGEGHLAFAGTGTTTIAHDGALLARLRSAHGAFARVPGSWRDWSDGRDF